MLTGAGFLMILSVGAALMLVLNLLGYRDSEVSFSQPSERKSLLFLIIGSAAAAYAVYVLSRSLSCEDWEYHFASRDECIERYPVSGVHYDPG